MRQNDNPCALLLSLRWRVFMAFLGGMAMICLPLGAGLAAEPSSVAVVGELDASPRSDGPFAQGVRNGLGDLGLVEGKNIAFDYRWPEGHPERFPSLAASLVERHVAVIISGGIAATLAAEHATPTIPIVFWDASDPVNDGLIASFKGPNGNVTGIALLQEKTTLKQVELLNELIPNKATLGILIDPNNSTASIENMAPTLEARFGRSLIFEHAAAESEFEKAFDSLSRQHAAGVVIPGSALYGVRHNELAAVAARHALPAIYFGPDRDLSVSGGLISYGAPLFDMFRLVGTMVGKILEGAKPEDMPVQAPTKIELKVNLKTAKSLGLTVPTSILVRADAVIE